MGPCSNETMLGQLVLPKIYERRLVSVIGSSVAINGLKQVNEIFPVTTGDWIVSHDLV